jgi:MFS family permease
MDKNNRLFIASVIALITTAFGFIVRAFLLTTWGTEMNLSATQLGVLNGAGLFPFALSIIFTSLFVDKIGYGRAMALAWVGHVASAIITMTASSYTQLYLGTFLFALANGVVEAVTNPVVATMYPKDKIKYLNILHSGWAGGQVIAGLLFIALGTIAWQWKIGLFLVPAIVYGVMMLGCKFPVNERVTAGVSYNDMLKEFGWAGCLLISYFSALALDSVLGVLGSGLPTAAVWAITIIPTVIFAIKIKSFGRPMFVFLLLIMMLLATTELGTDGWVTNLLTPILGSNGTYVLIYTSLLMVILRVFGAGALVRKMGPLGLLCACSLIAAAGLIVLANAGTGGGMIFIGATLYGVGKSFFWPTTLGTVSEQFPKGGALTLNAMGGMGMIAVGILGGPFLGALQDKKIDETIMATNPAIHQTVMKPEQTFPIIRGLDAGVTFQALDEAAYAKVPAAVKAPIDTELAKAKQHLLVQFAYLPIIMAIGFGILALYFKSKGGYKPVDLAASSH